MTAFIAALAVIVCLALLLLFRPFLRRQHDEGESRKQLNAAISRDELARLKEDLRAGLLDQPSYDQAVEELRLRLAQEVNAPDSVATMRSPIMTIAALVILLPVASVGLYLMLSNPQVAVDPKGYEQEAQKQVEDMVRGLAAKLEQDPGNLKGWAMLARSYKVLNRPLDAQRAYERAEPFIQDDAQMLADYADVVASNANGNFNGKPNQLIARALQVNPNNPMALWLAGTAAYQSSDFPLAIRYWEHLAGLLDPSSEDARLIQGALRDARGQMGQAAQASAVTRGSQAASASPADAALGAVSGVVEVDPALGARIKLDDIVMVIARAPDARMPVAVMRVRASELPLKFSLTDAMAMTPDARISSLASVVVEARVSKSGFAQPEPGDLYSDAQTVRPGDSNVRLYVNKVRP